MNNLNNLPDSETLTLKGKELKEIVRREIEQSTHNYEQWLIGGIRKMRQILDPGDRPDREQEYVRRVHRRNCLDEVEALMQSKAKEIIK